MENIQVCSWTDLAAKSQNQPEGSQEGKKPTGAPREKEALVWLV